MEKEVKYQKEYEDFVALFYQDWMTDEEKAELKKEFIPAEIFSLLIEKGVANGHTVDFQMKVVKQLFDFQMLIEEGKNVKDFFLNKLKELDEDDAKAFNSAVVETLSGSENPLEVMNIIHILTNNSIKNPDFDLYIYLNTLFLTKKNKDKYVNRQGLIFKAEYLVKNGALLKDKTQEETAKIVEDSK
jgi:hypothetical protein